MIQKLPVSNIRWMSQEEIDNFDLTGKEWKLDGNEGYWFEVDLQIDAEMHEV